MSPSPSSRYRRAGSARSLLSAAVLVALAAALPGALGGAVPSGSASSYELPLTAVNITDHNLTYATNMVSLGAVASASFDVTLRSTLVAKSGVAADRAEAEVGIGPVPAGSEETNITPLLIVQEAASGLLRIEYVPFPMNDTYGFVVYWGTPVAPGSSPFSGHVLGLDYVETAPPVPAYATTVYYGHTTGNLTVLWDGSVLVPPYPIAWSSFGAFYAYGLSTGAFASGSILANVTSSPAQGPGPQATLVGPGASLGAVPIWAIAAAVGAIVGGVIGTTLAHRRPIRP